MSIGNKIKLLRESKGLSLTELAKKAGLAKSTLFKIEENKTNPTINTIWSLAEVLGVSFSELASDSEIKDEGVSVVLLEKGENFESYKMSLKAGAKYIAKPHFAGTKERVYVLKGSVEVGSIDNIKKLHTGEITEFKADKRHIYSANTPSTLIVSLFYSKKRYFDEDVFVDVFDKEVYERINKLIDSGVSIIRVIAKIDKFDADNVIKNEHGIFIYSKNIKVSFNQPMSIKEYEKKVILKYFTPEIIHAAYFALIGEIELAKEYAIKNSKIKELLHE
jgi:transcriptional regulator with XRE-family HTH domain